MDETARRRFESFARAETDGLLRAAYLLTGDRHHAEDLVQTALAEVATRWRKVDDPAAYARRVLYTQAVSWWRRRRSRVVESLTAELPERQVPAFGEPELSMTLREALGRLTPKQRAVLILRFYEDLSETQTAARLGCRLGTVKSQTRHALRRLRQVAPELASFADPVRPASDRPAGMEVTS
ncbi:SigE family RNA polymerase sigma factor [Actinoplanes sp. NEAU-A12]|uniref:SigE family RNA polymerase sigma factor n=1 Tax=Actinoplanes sandaracinus TaxID=3045177 RepID=A0ABT6WKY4_9ACTN|nr:SigE family RNA polymerase sigma factor [Actinoplanes sandaracinus]